MVLRMENFNVLGIHWKIQLLGWCSGKTNIEGRLPKRGSLDSLLMYGRGAWQKKGVVFLRWRGGGDTRTYSSCFMHGIVTCTRLPFFKIFSFFIHFCPNFQIFCPFLPFFWIIARMPLLSNIDPGCPNAHYALCLRILS